jgi:lipopolysaccharide export system permease protein
MLMLIMMSIFLLIAYFHFVREAAAAKVNPKDITKIIVTEIPVLLQPIMPLSFFLSILLVFRYLFSSNEIISMYASGFSSASLFLPIFWLCLLFTILCSLTEFFIFPTANAARIHLLEESLHKMAFDKIFPGHFNQLSADQILYIDQKLSKENKLAGIFYTITLPEKNNEYKYDIVVAKSLQEQQMPDRSRYIVFSNGVRYTAKLTNLESLVTQFEKLAVRLTPPEFRLEDWPGCMSTKDLFRMAKIDRYAAAEWHWRLSIPLSLLNLTFFAIAFNYGRKKGYGNLIGLYPLVIYLLYINLLLVGMGLIKNSILNQQIGLWGIHAGMFLLSLVTLRYKPR